MANAQLVDLFMSEFAAKRDPMLKLAMRSMDQDDKVVELDLDKQKAQFIIELSGQIAAEKAGGNDGNVVAGLIRLLEKHSKS